MKVALLYNLNRGQSEQEAEFDSQATIDRLRKAIESEHDCETIEAIQDVRIWMVKLIEYQPDIIFNVAEGFEGAAREALYPALLEQLGYRYTGPGPTELLVCHNKALTKRLLERQGISMAWGKVLGSEQDIEALLLQDSLPFPLLVKLNSEGSSLGMDEHCVVSDCDELHRQLKSVWKKYQRNILVERFIPGRDLSMTFLEGKEIMGPVEYTYKTSRTYDFRLKTRDNDTIGVETPQDLSCDVRRKLFENAQKIVDVLDINGYCRIDFRLGDDGILYFLEVNGQVAFHPQGAFVLAAEPEMNFDEVVLHIIEQASQNRRRVSLTGVRLTSLEKS